MKLIQFYSCDIPFNGKERFLLYSRWVMSATFHFVVSLRSFLIWEARLPLYAVKNCLNISTIFINYQQRVIAVYINYGSRSSKTLGSESEIIRGMAKFGKPTKKSDGAVRRQLSSSVSGLVFFHVRSVAALHPLVVWSRLAKHWKTN